MKVISELSDLRGINIHDYAMIVFDSEITIPPWKIIRDIKSSLGNQPCPPSWVRGDMNTITKSFLEASQLTGSVLVTKDSKVVISTCNGKVDGQLSSDAPNIEMDTPHNICSIGKMLTGLTTLQLIQNGKLELTDQIYDYLPEGFPNKEKFQTVTVGQLLTHTAGMGNYTEKYNIALNDPNQEDPQFKSLDSFVRFIDNPDSLNVGSFKYSNVGYVVLGKVIEKAANKGKTVSEHQNYWDVVNELILAPNAITITRDKPQSKNPATNSQFATTIKIASSPAGANMWATPAELDKFAYLVMRRIQESPEYESLLENLKVRMYSGEEIYYSAGIMMGKNSMGENFYYHNGGARGISSHLRIDPSTQMTETVFINNDSDDKDLASGLVAATVESYVMDAKANHVYYADPKFSDNPEQLFQQVAQEAGVNLVSTPLVNREPTQRFRDAMAQTRHSELASTEVEELDKTREGKFDLH
ncbi:beta-lactamase [Legionella beliardensis]|uniref:Beta-lactamase n=1 Tax=Legionella beliardensis TaxID=91822 RepID=A0A378IBX0_9GAMM|nr:serine hydrolase domain-containing protein [Legionella beliardensis]STX29794.1 beta-lactamase [Legionella beliardensis]